MCTKLWAGLRCAPSKVGAAKPATPTITKTTPRILQTVFAMTIPFPPVKTGQSRLRTSIEEPCSPRIGNREVFRKRADCTNPCTHSQSFFLRPLCMTKSGSFQMIKNYSQVSALLPKKDPKAGKRRNLGTWHERESEATRAWGAVLQEEITRRGSFSIGAAFVVHKGGPRKNSSRRRLRGRIRFGGWNPASLKMSTR